MAKQEKLTPEMKMFILNNPKKSSYVLRDEIKKEFGLEITHTSVNNFRNFYSDTEKFIEEETGIKEMKLEELFELITNQEKGKGKLRKYWEGTIASLLVSYYINRKKKRKTDE